MKEFTVKNDFIELCNLLKLEVPMSGGEAKHVISEGLVSVDGNVETRKKCKIRPGQTVSFEQFTILVKA